MKCSSSIYERLFAAVAGDIPFSGALETIIDAFDGAGGVVFELNRKTGVITNWVGEGLEPGEEEYIEHMNAINPRMRYSLRHAAGHVLYEGKFTDENSMDRSEFYDWLERTTGLRYFLGTRILDEGDVSLFHSIEFTKTHGHPDTDKIAAFKRVAPTIGNAWRVSKTLGQSCSDSTANIWALDHLPWAIFALQDNGSVVEVNRSAAAMINSGGVVHISDGTLIATDRKSNANLHRIMKNCFLGEAGETLLHAGELAPPLIAQVVPVNPMKVPGPSNVVTLLYIWNPVQRSKNISSVLSYLYGLSQAEARLAQVLAGGGSVVLAAEQLGISRNTARNQLQSIFAKTKTKSQNELLVRILGILDTQP